MIELLRNYIRSRYERAPVIRTAAPKLENPSAPASYERDARLSVPVLTRL